MKRKTKKVALWTAVEDAMKALNNGTYKFRTNTPTKSQKEKIIQLEKNLRTANQKYSAYTGTVLDDMHERFCDTNSSWEEILETMNKRNGVLHKRMLGRLGPSVSRGFKGLFGKSSTLAKTVVPKLPNNAPGSRLPGGQTGIKSSPITGKEPTPMAGKSSTVNGATKPLPPTMKGNTVSQVKPAPNLLPQVKAPSKVPANSFKIDGINRVPQTKPQIGTPKEVSKTPLLPEKIAPSLGKGSVPGTSSQQLPQQNSQPSFDKISSAFDKDPTLLSGQIRNNMKIGTQPQQSSQQGGFTLDVLNNQAQAANRPKGLTRENAQIGL